jgi:hypothetical protein
MMQFAQVILDGVEFEMIQAPVEPVKKPKISEAPTSVKTPVVDVISPYFDFV